MQSLPLNNGYRFSQVELKHLPELAQFILAHRESAVTLLEAPMGSGKTTLCNAILQAWGSEQAGSSPTFALIEEYHGTQGKCYHLDAYRIEDISMTCNLHCLIRSRVKYKTRLPW